MTTIEILVIMRASVFQLITFPYWRRSCTTMIMQLFRVRINVEYNWTINEYWHPEDLILGHALPVVQEVTAADPRPPLAPRRGQSLITNTSVVCYACSYQVEVTKLDKAVPR